MAKSDKGRPAPPAFDWKTITPEDSPRGLPDVMADPVHQRLSTPDVRAGDRAFDFDLPISDFSTGVERSTSERFHLQSAAENRPVALIFGSYT